MILLIRHATHDWLGRIVTGWMPGVHLNARGIAESEALAERLEPAGVAAVYSSPLERCRETAEPLALRVPCPIMVRATLGEVQFGAWTGAPYAELARDPEWRAWNERRGSARPPGGESLLEVQTRVIDELEHIGAQFADGQLVAVVSHGDVIRAALVHCLGMELDAIQRIELAPASISTVTFGARGPRVLSMNDTARLPEPSDAWVHASRQARAS